VTDDREHTSRASGPGAETEDYAVTGMSRDGRFRVIAVRSTVLVEEGRRRHGCSKTATAALGRVMTGAVLMAATLDEDQSVTLRVLGGGPAGGVIADSYRAADEIRVRGYMGDPGADLPSPSGKLDVGGLVGKLGSIYVTKDLGLKEFYTGSARLQSGEIGIDLAYYYTVSEQLPSAVSVGVRLGGMPRSRERRRPAAGWVTGAGGIMVQVMAGQDAEDAGDTGEAADVVGRVQANLEILGSVSLLIQDGATPEELVQAAFVRVLDLQILARIRARFACRCTRERAISTLASLGRNDLRRLASEQEKTEVRCHFCNEVYVFTGDELREIAESASSSSAE
jgi:molecular chaperone Hsp33